MTLPNLLTLSRIAFAPLLWACLFWDFVWAKALALVIFIVASLTDFFDGLLARRQKTKTRFGAIMDPVADKILILTAFFAFVRLGIIPLWLVLIILFREVIVTLLRLWVIRRGIVMPAQRAGKQKTVSQIVVVLFILLFLSVRGTGGSLEPVFLKIGFYLALLAMGFTLISGAAYLFDLKRSLKSGAGAAG